MPASSSTTAPAAWTLARIAVEQDHNGAPLLCLKLSSPHLDQLRQQGRQRAELAGLTAADQCAHDGALQSGLTAATRFAEVERTVRELERGVKLAEIAHEQARDTPGESLADITATQAALDKAQAALLDARAGRDNARGHLVSRVNVLRRDIKGEAFDRFAPPIADAAERAWSDAKAKLKTALAKVGPVLDDVVPAMAGRKITDDVARKAFVATLTRQLEQTIGIDLLDRLEREEEQAQRVAAIERDAKDRQQAGQYVPTIGY